MNYAEIHAWHIERQQIERQIADSQISWDENNQPHFTDKSGVMKQIEIEGPY